MNNDIKYVFILNENILTQTKVNGPIYISRNIDFNDGSDETLKLSKALIFDSLKKAEQFHIICNLRDYTLSEVKRVKVFKALLEDK